MRYEVTEAGNMLDIGGKRRRAGDIVTLNKTEAEFEVLRETVVEYKADKAEPEVTTDASAPKAKGK